MTDTTPEAVERLIDRIHESKAGRDVRTDAIATLRALLAEIARPRAAQTQPEDVGPDHYDRSRRDMLNAILALNPAADALCAEMHGRTPDPHGKLPFDVLLWVTIVAEQLGIEPKVDPLAKQGGAE